MEKGIYQGCPPKKMHRYVPKTYQYAPLCAIRDIAPTMRVDRARF